MGPCQCLCMDPFELLLANPSSLAKGMCSISSSHLKLCRPLRQSCMAAQCVLGGPMRAAWIHITVHEMGPCRRLRVDSFKLLWANPSSLTREICSHNWPMPAFRPAANLLTKIIWAHATFCVVAHCGLDGPMQAACVYMMVHEMGPCQCLCIISFMLLWANLSPLAVAVHLYHRPMRA